MGLLMGNEKGSELEDFCKNVEPSLDLKAFEATLSSLLETGAFQESREPKKAELTTGGRGGESTGTPTLKEVCKDLTEEAEEVRMGRGWSKRQQKRYPAPSYLDPSLHYSSHRRGR